MPLLTGIGASTALQAAVGHGQVAMDTHHRPCIAAVRDVASGCNWRRRTTATRGSTRQWTSSQLPPKKKPSVLMD
ncbi:hypothetical protein FHY19_004535 [Xanthomonas arboricola]|nr:hypothetical protein [Xanthomonas sp. 4461]